MTKETTILVQQHRDAAALEARVVRYGDLVPCFNAFVDSRTPGSDAKENFTIIGPGVSENPDQHVHIAEPHGFNIGGARQPPDCVNSQHSHDTAEVFVVHSGQWRFDFGEHGDDAQVFAGPGDIVSFPVRTFAVSGMSAPMQAFSGRCWAATIRAACYGRHRYSNWHASTVWCCWKTGRSSIRSQVRRCQKVWHRCQSPAARRSSICA